MLSALLNKIKWATNVTAEKEEPLEPFRLEGFVNGDTPSAEHINFLFNAYYELFNEINGGEGVFSTKDSIAVLQAVDTTGLTGNAWTYVKGFGVYGFVSTLSPVATNEYIIKPTTGSGAWVLKLPDPDYIRTLTLPDLGLINKDIRANIQAIKALNESLTLLINRFDNTAKIITRNAFPTGGYSPINATSEVTFWYEVEGAENGDSASISFNKPIQAGLGVTQITTNGNSVGVTIRNFTAGSLTPTNTDLAITVFKRGTK